MKISIALLVALYLFNGSLNNTISKIAILFVIFFTSSYMNLNFYIILLGPSCYLVLYNWLAQHNSLID